jgi:hypothetical protein
LLIGFIIDGILGQLFALFTGLWKFTVPNEAINIRNFLKKDVQSSGRTTRRLVYTSMPRNGGFGCHNGLEVYVQASLLEKHQEVELDKSLNARL